MRLNPFYPSDDPMSSVFYCFGGGGDSGGGGGDSRSEADRSYEDDFGFSSDIAGGFSGSAADIGGRDDNGGDDRPAPAPAPAPSAMDTAIANALANIDTASLADISTPMVGGAFVDPTTGFGIMQDIPGPAMQSAMDVAQAATPGLYGSQATTGDSFEDLYGLTDSFFGTYETTPVPRGPEFNAFPSPSMTQDNVYNMFGGPGPRTAALGSGPTVDEVVRAMNLEGEVVPGFGASIDRAISDFMGETYGGITEQLPEGGISKELFTDLGDFVSQPTDFLSAYNPVAQQRMQEGYLADYGIEIPNIEVFGQKIPMSPILAGVNAIANPEYTMTQALRQGAAPVYGTLPGQEGSILGATSPSGDIVYSNAPFGDSLAAIKGTFGSGPGLDPNMEAAYARQRELDDAERARNDSGDQAAPPALTLPDPVTQECPEGYTRDGSGICVYEGQPRVGVTPYTPMAPVEFSYTGLPSLAPRTLTPTAPNLSFLNRR